METKNAIGSIPTKESGWSNSSGNVNGSLAIQRKMASHVNATGTKLAATDMVSSGWSHGGGIYTNASGLVRKTTKGRHRNSSGEEGYKGFKVPSKGYNTVNSSGDYKGFKVPSRGDYTNAAGTVGKITWNDIDKTYEDSDGKTYTINDDQKTFDDGSGNSFNADGTLATKSSSGGFLDKILTVVENVAPQVLSSTVKQSSNDAQVKVTQSQNAKATTNNWVLPVTLIGGVVAVGLVYHYFIAKKK